MSVSAGSRRSRAERSLRVLKEESACRSLFEAQRATLRQCYGIAHTA